VRIAKVFTDLPLVPDSPINLGVREFCESCRRCSKACPPKAIPDGPPSDEKLNVSTLGGVKKWTVHPEKCFKFWAAQGTDCSICIRVCPFNKDFSKPLHRFGLRVAQTPLRSALIWLDEKLGYGKREKPGQWWRK